MRTILGALIGAAVGFALGVVGWLAFFYLVFMVPEGIEFRRMDQGAIPTVFTGPLGAVLGSVIGCLVARRRRKVSTAHQAAGATRSTEGRPSACRLRSLRVRLGRHR